MTHGAQLLEEPAVDGLDPVDRRSLADLWAGVTRAGAGDVAGLAELAVLLAALGAPLALAGRAAACSAAQAGSVAASGALAGAYAGAPVDLPVPAGLLGRPPGGVRRARPALRRLAVRALRDGCLLGGHAAQVTCWASATATDPAVQAALAVVADTEARAVALWSDVLDWTLAQRPRLVARLRDVDLVERSPLAELVRGVAGDPVVLAAHGWPRASEVDRLWAAHRAGVLARLG